MNSATTAREDVQRVSIDTINDWKRIKSNFSSAAFAALDEILEASGGSVDKDALLPHVDQFIQKTFEIARANVRVNGRNLDEVPESEEDSETFDEGLDRRIWSLGEQCMQWDVDISKKRRERPLEVERLLKDLLSRLDEDEPMEEDTEVEVDEEALIPSHLDELATETNDICEELDHLVPIQSQRLETLLNTQNELRKSKIL
ncbi:hypothetical protein BJ322DRAFT_1064876 [Thelephora terrestris]|uniref:Uncharacterized protein n=1 Tax=Thelephora terrestris TaxID=56493 RepID=A0A9P6HDJ3_9AGAM|nr:hypothetical protein BJ322DRAFT_1064876 [Thelephora terrestris]